MSGNQIDNVTNLFSPEQEEDNETKLEKKKFFDNVYNKMVEDREHAINLPQEEQQNTLAMLHTQNLADWTSLRETTYETKLKPHTPPFHFNEKNAALKIKAFAKRDVNQAISYAKKLMERRLESTVTDINTPS